MLRQVTRVVLLTLCTALLYVNCDKKDDIGNPSNPVKIIAFWDGINVNKDSQKLKKILTKKTKLHFKFERFSKRKDFKEYINNNNDYQALIISPVDFLDIPNKDLFNEIAVASRYGLLFRTGQCMINPELAKKHKIKTLKDTLGLNCAFVKKSSQTGYLLPLLVLGSINNKPDEFYNKTKFCKKHQEVVREILRARDIKRDYAVGWAFKDVQLGVSYYVEGSDTLKVLSFTPKIPNEIFYIKNDIDKKTYINIEQAFKDRFAISKMKKELQELFRIKSFEKIPKYDDKIVRYLYSIRKKFVDKD